MARKRFNAFREAQNDVRSQLAGIGATVKSLAATLRLLKLQVRELEARQTAVAREERLSQPNGEHLRADAGADE
jgi:hypothetical protein